MFADLMTIIITTIVFGSVYTLIAIGLTLIFQTVRYFNFAHGAFFSAGAYFIWYLLNVLNFDYYLAIILLIPFSFLLGCFVQTVIQPLIDKEASPLVLILASFCVGSLIESGILILFGARPKLLPYPFEGSINFGGGVTMAYHKVLILLISFLLLTALILILYKTKIGIAMRAIAQERDAAYMVGINVKKLYAFSVGLSAILAGIGGWLLGCMLFLNPYLGSSSILWSGFIICTLAGSKAGLSATLLTAYLVAFLEATLMRYLPAYDVPPIIFMIVMIMLIIRPEGLFVKR
ncbi:MAG: branched-chain amino acid ABC transporter permease [Thermofilaceae archaeon]